MTDEVLNLSAGLRWCTTLFGDVVHPLYGPDQSWPLDWTEAFKEYTDACRDL